MHGPSAEPLLSGVSLQASAGSSRASTKAVNLHTAAMPLLPLLLFLGMVKTALPAPVFSAPTEDR